MSSTIFTLRLARGFCALSTILLRGGLQLNVFIGAPDIVATPREERMGAYDLGCGIELFEDIADKACDRSQTVERNIGRVVAFAIRPMSQG